jgi:centractin
VGAERFQAPEILFSPEIMGQEYQGVHQMLVDSIQRTDLDLRKRLYGNIILSGGSTLFPGKTNNHIRLMQMIMILGFGTRMLEEVKKQIVSDIKIKIFAPPERKYSTWIGGSILASLSTFKKMWVSAEEYQEDPYIIHRKTF